MDIFFRMLRVNLFAQLTLVFFILLTIWWIIIYLGGTKDAPVNNNFGFVYGGFTIWGGVIGIFAARNWGGWSSLIGKALLCLSVGLLSEGFGQYSFWFINIYQHIEVPYPGIPDIGFFGTIPFYIIAALLLAKASGAKFALQSLFNKSQAIIIPVVMLLIAYGLFLRQYTIDLSNPLKMLLDFGYPLGQAGFISIAILTYSLSRNLLGGIMRFPILFLIIAFVAQFLADYVFIYFQDQFYPASFMDYLYLIAYFLMTLGLIQMKRVEDELKSL